MNWSSGSIRTKLLLLSIASGMVAFVVAAILVARQTLFMLDVAENQLRSQSDLIAAQTTAALAFEDPKAAQQTLETLSAIPEIAAATLYDAQGAVFASYIRARKGERHPPVIETIPDGLQRMDDWLALIHKPVVALGGTDERLGSLSLVYDLSQIRERAYSSAAISALIGILATVTALLGTLAIYRLLARPLSELDRTARRVSIQRDYTARAEKYGDNELGRLTNVFNEMLAEVEKAERQRDQLLEREQRSRVDAERASQLKDEFVATLSHELRSPLTSIIGWAHVLRQLSGGGEAGHSTEDADQMARGLEVIERNAHVQAQLVEDLLDMSRIVSGKLRLDVQDVRLETVIEQALATAEPAMQAKQIRLQKIQDSNVPPLHGDPARLQQIVWNLLSNAVKFTPRGGRIQVLLKRVNSHVEIVVSDTGEGIREEFLPHIFERFRQADASTTREHGGLGLGLAIVKHLVELHGGTITALSPGVGKGATFTVKLPLAILHPVAEERVHPRAVPQQPAAIPAVPWSGLKDTRVLVVEDDPDARDLVRRLVEKSGGEVYCAGSADEALHAMDEFRPHVLISDIGMPGKDGYQFIREVRVRPVERGGMIPAIALTAFARAEDRTRALLAGYQAHLAKPITPAELIACVASLLLLNVKEP